MMQAYAAAGIDNRVVSAVSFHTVAAINSRNAAEQADYICTVLRSVSSQCNFLEAIERASSATASSTINKGLTLVQ
ncbi:hypothetical protein EJB05_34948, partial [Eragrostis curvula]